MIFSDKQYSVTTSERDKLKKAQDEASNRSTDQIWLRDAEVAAIGSQIADLEAELVEYDRLKSGEVTFSKSHSLEELPRALVQARIASGTSQSELAERLGMKPQQIQRYEATNYMGASLARLIEVSRELNVKVSGTFESETQAGDSVFAWNNSDDIVWSEFPAREMAKRKWFDVPRGANPVELAKNYFLSVAGPQFATAYHRKKMRGGNIPNEYSLLAWQARVLERAKNASDNQQIAEFNLDDRWLPELVSLTKLVDGPIRAKKLLAENGIALIVEKHLPGSYLDGAAMLGDSERPIVGLTLRHDRLDNFWFVLLHEIGHVFLHLFDGLRFDFFDEESSPDSDTVELEADHFALEALIPEDQWNQCLSRFALTEKAVSLDAEKLGIDPSIVAGRIRKEQENFRILNSLVGQGLVRKQFEEVSNAVD